LKNNANFVVVGDIFKNPKSAVANILSESEAIELILRAGPLEHDVAFTIQQGVNVNMLEHAIRHHEASAPRSHGRFILERNPEMPRAVRRLAHKMRAENICVSFPQRIAENQFELDLHFSAQNELFLDHMTGAHIQGMALTEAARQAFLTVTEEFFLKDSNDKWYFVTHHHNAEFKQFVFPFAAQLHYHIQSHTVKNGRQSFEVKMEIHQAGLCCCSFDVSFTTFEATRLAQREDEMMGERVSDILNKPQNEREFTHSMHALAAAGEAARDTVEMAA